MQTALLAVLYCRTGLDTPPPLDIFCWISRPAQQPHSTLHSNAHTCMPQHASGPGNTPRLEGQSVTTFQTRLLMPCYKSSQDVTRPHCTATKHNQHHQCASGVVDKSTSAEHRALPHYRFRPATSTEALAGSHIDKHIVSGTTSQSSQPTALAADHNRPQQKLEPVVTVNKTRLVIQAYRQEPSTLLRCNMYEPHRLPMTCQGNTTSKQIMQSFAVTSHQADAHTSHAMQMITTADLQNRHQDEYLQATSLSTTCR